MSEEFTKTDVVQFRDTQHLDRLETILAVGSPDEWRHQGIEMPTENLVLVAFKDLTEATLEEFRPAMILSPVLAQGFDCIELTLLLRNLGYKGEYCAIAHDMPKPTLIEREVKQLYPDLNFKIEINV